MITPCFFVCFVLFFNKMLLTYSILLCIMFAQGESNGYKN